MRVKAIKQFSSTTYGNVEPGQVIDAPEGLAQQYLANGLAQKADTYSTKVIREVPTDAGEAKEFTSSPADQASRKKTRGRRKASESSRSTEASSSPRTPTLSMRGTTNGGDTTGTTGEDSEG